MKFFSITDKGLHRAINEDYFKVRDDIEGISLAMVIADGMGGHEGGEVASRLAVDSVITYIGRYFNLHTVSTQGQGNKNPAVLIENAAKYANRRIIDLADRKPELKGMGTTLVIALVINGTLHIGNVGDSRLYLYDDAGMQQITVDHSLVEEQVRSGFMTRSEAERSSYKNIITHVVGSESSMMLDYYSRELGAATKIMICTDGLTNMLNDAELGKIIQMSGNPEEACREMIRLANLNGGEDNITVLIAENQGLS